MQPLVLLSHSNLIIPSSSEVSRSSTDACKQKSSESNLNSSRMPKTTTRRSYLPARVSELLHLAPSWGRKDDREISSFLWAHIFELIFLYKGHTQVAKRRFFRQWSFCVPACLRSSFEWTWCTAGNNLLLLMIFTGTDQTRAASLCRTETFSATKKGLQWSGFKHFIMRRCCIDLWPG